MKSNAEFAAQDLIQRAVRADNDGLSLDTAAIYEAAARLFGFVGDGRRATICDQAATAIRKTILELEEDSSSETD